MEQIIYWKELAKFKEDHKNCGLEYKLTNDDKNTVVVRCAYHSQLRVTVIPYRQFCHSVSKCAGHNSCPMHYACSE